MIRLYEKNNNLKFRDFEDFLFTYPENHNISFDFANDVCSIDGIDYRISSVEKPQLETYTLQDYIFTSKDDSDSTQYFGAVKRTKNKTLIMKVTETQTLYFIGSIENYQTNWENRVSLTFSEPQNIEL